MRGVCNRDLTMKKIAYDEETNTAHILSFRLAKLVNDTSDNIGGRGHKFFAPPEEFINQKTGVEVTDEEFDQRTYLLSKAGYAADVFMIALDAYLVWRPLREPAHLKMKYTDCIKVRAMNDWCMHLEAFKEIYDVNAEQKAAIQKQLQAMVQKKPEDRPAIDVCLRQLELLALNDKLTSIPDSHHAEIFAAHTVAEGLRADLDEIEVLSLLHLDIRNCTHQFGYLLQMPMKKFVAALESCRDPSCHMLAQHIKTMLIEAQSQLTIETYLQEIKAKCNRDVLKHAFSLSLSMLPDTEYALLEFTEYLGIQILRNITQKNILIEKVENIFHKHAAMSEQLFQCHQQCDINSQTVLQLELKDIQQEIANDSMTLDNMAAQAAHMERKFGKLKENKRITFSI
jgi:hypothetical protein